MTNGTFSGAWVRDTLNIPLNCGIWDIYLILS
jgi:hypothetical protein